MIKRIYYGYNKDLTAYGYFDFQVYDSLDVITAKLGENAIIIKVEVI